MPFYDFRCPTCDERFEVRRPIAESDQPMPCPKGHPDAVRVITTWGTGGGIRSGTPSKVVGRGGGSMSSLDRDAKKIAQHKRHG